MKQAVRWFCVLLGVFMSSVGFGIRSTNTVLDGRGVLMVTGIDQAAVSDAEVWARGGRKLSAQAWGVSCPISRCGWVATRRSTSFR